MKVLQIIPTFGVAGAEKVVLNYLKYNQSDTMHIKAISLYPSQNSMYDQEIAAKGLDVTYLHKGHGFDISVVKELKNAIKQYNPDVIHTHLYALKYLLLTGEMKNRKIFHTIHNQPDKDVGKLDELINRYCFRKSKVIPVTLQDELDNVLVLHASSGVQATKSSVARQKQPEPVQPILAEFSKPANQVEMAKCDASSEEVAVSAESEDVSGHFGKMVSMPGRKKKSVKNSKDGIRDKQELKENLGKIREGIRETAAAADTPKEQTAKILRQMDSDEQERVIREVLKELLS